MEPASILAIIILVIALLILVYYYLQTINHPIYQNMHTQATDLTSRLEQDKHVANFSDQLNKFGNKIKDKVEESDDDQTKDKVSKTDIISKKIDQFINEQSEQVITDWDLVTHKDLNEITAQFDKAEANLNSYKKSNDIRVEDLEKRVNRLDEEFKNFKINDSTPENKKVVNKKVVKRE